MNQLQGLSVELCDALEYGFDLVPSDTPIDTKWFDIKARESFEPFAEDASGGVFLSGVVTGKVLYVSSEGQAGIVARSLIAFIELIVTHPYWFDLLKFSGDGSINEMQRALPYLEEDDKEDSEQEIIQSRKAVAQYFKVEKSSSVIADLHEAVMVGDTELQVLSADGKPFDSLFNKFTVESNPMWVLV